MPVMENFKRLAAKLKQRKDEAADDRKVVYVVGYTAAYAAAVHESTSMSLAGQPRKKPGKGLYWDPQGKAQPKFLEAPARRLAKTLGQIVADAKKKGKTLSQGVMLAALRLQRESQAIVPVDTGNLKNSAFTRRE